MSRPRGDRKTRLKQIALRMRVDACRPKTMALAAWRALPAGERFAVYRRFRNLELQREQERRRVQEVISRSRPSELYEEPATPETKARLAAEPPERRDHPLRLLFTRGKISQAEWNAAEEIAATYAARTSDMRVKLASYEGRVDRSGHWQVQDDSNWMIEAQSRYLEWTSMVRRKRLNLPAVLQVVALSTSIARTAARYGLDHDTVRRHVIKALGHYVDMVARRRRRQPRVEKTL